MTTRPVRSVCGHQPSVSNQVVRHGCSRHLPYAMGHRDVRLTAMARPVATWDATGDQRVDRSAMGRVGPGLDGWPEHHEDRSFTMSPRCQS